MVLNFIAFAFHLFCLFLCEQILRVWGEGCLLTCSGLVLMESGGWDLNSSLLRSIKQ